MLETAILCLIVKWYRVIVYIHEGDRGCAQDGLGLRTFSALKATKLQD